jgi:D-lactate dehydrogenase
MRDQRLLNRSDVVFTPHVAFNSVETVGRINQMTVESIKAFLSGTPVGVISAPLSSDATVFSAA